MKEFKGTIGKWNITTSKKGNQNVKRKIIP